LRRRGLANVPLQSAQRELFWFSVRQITSFAEFNLFSRETVMRSVIIWLALVLGVSLAVAEEPAGKPAAVQPETESTPVEKDKVEVSVVLKHASFSADEQPEFIVLSDREKMLMAPGPHLSPTLFDWWDTYQTNYTRVGLADIVLLDANTIETTYAFGTNAVARHGKIHRCALEIFQRQPAPSHP
jgi:hypothetical protein